MRHIREGGSFIVHFLRLPSFGPISSVVVVKGDLSFGSISVTTRLQFHVTMDLSEPRLQGLDISKLPISMPPPGVIPNFKNPQTIAGAIITIGVVMVILTVTFVALRLYSNHHANRKYGLDDCMIPSPRISHGQFQSCGLILIAGRYVYRCNHSVLGGHGC